MFRIDEYGRIYSNASFDRETRDSYQFTVTVTDAGSPALTDTKQVFVRIEDVNDNHPTFTDPSGPLVTYTVNENTPVGTSVGTLRASDIDLGVNAQVRFAGIFTENILAINPNSGVITVAKQFDYEFEQYDELFAIAEDMGTPKLQSMLNTRSNTNNINDNRPYFPVPEYTITVS
jgi:hypothetical protein